MSIYHSPANSFSSEIEDWFLKNPISNKDLIDNYGLEPIPGTGWFKGYSHTEESKLKMREKASKPRKPHSETRKRNISLSHQGKTLTEEHKHKISQSMVGNPSWTGKNHSIETRQRMKESHSKPVCCGGKYYASISEAASLLNISEGGIRYRLKIRQDYYYI